MIDDSNASGARWRVDVECRSGQALQNPGCDHADPHPTSPEIERRRSGSDGVAPAGAGPCACRQSDAIALPGHGPLTSLLRRFMLHWVQITIRGEQVGAARQIPASFEAGPGCALSPPEKKPFGLKANRSWLTAHGYSLIRISSWSFRQLAQWQDGATNSAHRSGKAAWAWSTVPKTV